MMKRLSIAISIILLISFGICNLGIASDTSTDGRMYLKIIQKGKMGLINTDGAVVMQPAYQDIGYMSNGMLPVKKKGKWGFVDNSFKEVIKPSYDEVLWFRNGWCPVRIGSMWGIMDSKGALVVKPAYSMIDIDNNEKIAVVKLKNKYGVLDNTGKVAVPIKYDQIHFLNKGFLAFTVGNKTGIMDKTGKQIMAPEYGDIWKQTDFPKDYKDLFLVEYNQKTYFTDGYTTKVLGRGLCDSTGKLIFEAKYYSFSYLPGGFIRVEDLNYNIGIADENGNFLLQPAYKNLDSLDQGTYIASKDNIHYGVINDKGEEIIKPIYTQIFKFGENLLVNYGGKWSFGRPGSSVTGGKWGIIDKKGNEIVPPKYENISCNVNFASVRENNQVSVINSEGKVIINALSAQSFLWGKDVPLLILNNDKGGHLSSAGFFDENGKSITSKTFPFQNAQNFSEGLAAVQVKGKWGYIDITGKVVIPCQYEYVQGFSNGASWVSVISKDGKRKYGVINKKGKYLYYPQFENPSTNSFVQVYDYK